MQKAIYINGLWLEPRSGQTKSIVNPATGEMISEVGYGGRDEALAAVAAADAAFESWRQKTVYERAAMLRMLADAIRDRQDDLAHILTMEVGKPLAEAGAEIGAAADQFEWYAEEVKRAAGDVIPPRLDNRRHLTIRHPVGPVAAITPWNFPVMLAARKMAPAMAAALLALDERLSRFDVRRIYFKKVFFQSLFFKNCDFSFNIGLRNIYNHPRFKTRSQPFF